MSAGRHIDTYDLFPIQCAPGLLLLISRLAEPAHLFRGTDIDNTSANLSTVQTPLRRDYRPDATFQPALCYDRQYKPWYLGELPVTDASILTLFADTLEDLSPLLRFYFAPGPAFEFGT
jgi:hypothetical protein